MSETLHDNIPLIEVNDSLVLGALLAAGVASRYIITRLSAQVAVVVPGRMDELFARLRKLDHTPRVLSE